MDDRRRYVRHPIRVPLAVRPKNAGHFLSRAADISEGGISFDSRVPMTQGDIVEVELPVHHSRFTLAGTVASSAPLPGGGFRIGLSFVEPGTAFKIKLAEQVLRIAELQQTLSKEAGREVSSREAAQVWVEKYAETFADLV